jgi:hypothetical protein
MTITDPSVRTSTCARCGRTGAGPDWTDRCAECDAALCRDCFRTGCCGRVPARSVSTLTHCSVCGGRCIAQCPACGKYVCQAYGFINQNCSGLHEVSCPGSKRVIPGRPKTSPSETEPAPQPKKPKKKTAPRRLDRKRRVSR